MNKSLTHVSNDTQEAVRAAKIRAMLLDKLTPIEAGAIADVLIAELKMFGGGNRYAALGAADIYAKKLSLAAGAPTREESKKAQLDASMFAIAHAQELGVKDADGSYLNDADRKEFIELTNKGFHITTDQWIEYHRMGIQGKGNSWAAEQGQRCAPEDSFAWRWWIGLHGEARAEIRRMTIERKVVERDLMDEFLMERQRLMARFG